VTHSSLPRRGLIALGAALVFAGAADAQLARQDPKSCKGQAEIKPLEALQLSTGKGIYKFQVEIADNETEREYGLMCRKALAADRGMLFLFDQADYQAFWMRNTLIPLDIVYIGSDGRVVSIVRNARPLDESPLPSGGKAQFTLELAAGRAEQIGLLPGDKVIHRAIKRG
jgi:uncharacterized membrane protein (UPF0127 family)